MRLSSLKSFVSLGLILSFIASGNSPSFAMRAVGLEEGSERPNLARRLREAGNRGSFRQGRASSRAAGLEENGTLITPRTKLTQFRPGIRLFSAAEGVWWLIDNVSSHDVVAHPMVAIPGLPESKKFSKDALLGYLSYPPSRNGQAGLEEAPLYIVDNPESRTTVALVAKGGGTTITVQAATPEGLLKGTDISGVTVRNPGVDTQEKILDQMVDQASLIINRVGPNNVMYLHISFPGFFNDKMVLMRDEENIPGLKAKLDLAQELQHRLALKYPRPAVLGPIPVIVVHDGTGHANGERSRFGKFPGAQTLFLVAPGTGIATRAIINGKAFTGGPRVQYLANEVHTLVFNGDPENPDYTLIILETEGDHPDFKNQTRTDGTPNPYFGKQDLEDRTRGPAIGRYAVQLVQSGQFGSAANELIEAMSAGRIGTKIKEGQVDQITDAELDQITRVVGQMAAQGTNALALKAVRDRARELGIGLAVLLVEFHKMWREEFPYPPHIVLAGGVSQIGAVYFNAVRDGFRDRLQQYAARQTIPDLPPVEEFVNRLQQSDITHDSDRELLAGLPTEKQVREHQEKLREYDVAQQSASQVQITLSGKTSAPFIQVPSGGVRFGWRYLEGLGRNFMGVIAVNPQMGSNHFLRIVLPDTVYSRGEVNLDAFFAGLRVELFSPTSNPVLLTVDSGHHFEALGVHIEMDERGILVRPSGTDPIVVAPKPFSAGLEEVDRAKLLQAYHDLSVKFAGEVIPKNQIGFDTFGRDGRQEYFDSGDPQGVKNWLTRDPGLIIYPDEKVGKNFIVISAGSAEKYPTEWLQKQMTLLQAAIAELARLKEKQIQAIAENLAQLDKQPTTAGLEEAKEAVTGWVAVGGAAAVVPAGVPHVYGVAVGLRQTRPILEMGRVSPMRMVVVATGLEEVAALTALGIPESQIVQGWRFASLEDAKEAAVQLAQRILETIDTVKVQVLQTTARTVQGIIAQIGKWLPSTWQEAITAQTAQQIVSLNELGV